MILITHKWMTLKNAANKDKIIQERIKREVFRLISIVKGGTHVVCERLHDEYVSEDHEPQCFKGDFETFELSHMRIIHNTDSTEDEYERYRHLQELSVLINGK